MGDAKMVEREKTPMNLKSVKDTKINPKKTSIPLQHNIVRQYWYTKQFKNQFQADKECNRLDSESPDKKVNI